MPLPQNWRKKKRAPTGFDVVEPVLEALENELRDKIKETSDAIRKNEAYWPVHQINWQKSRYIYDMYYTYNKISKQVYQYCIDQKLVDAALIAKWKKPGYERLCSTYVINPQNYKFGTTSICRVPWKDRGEDQKHVRDPTTGCLGCASGGGPRNIFGNKYGQNLAAVQMAREQRMEEKRRREAEAAAREEEEDSDDASTDDEDDFGPAPSAGIWAGSKRLEKESEKLVDPDGEDETDDDGEAETDDDEEGPMPKKARVES